MRVMTMNRLASRALLTLLLVAGLPAWAEVPLTGSPVSHSAPVSWSAGRDLSYDASGNITAVGSDTFAYDKVGRVIQSTVNGITRKYQYDAWGNQTGCCQGTDCSLTPIVTPCAAGLLGYETDAKTNRLTSASGAVTYDAAGRVVTMNGHTYTYDALDAQVSDTKGPGQWREYVYDASGERIGVYDSQSDSWQWTVRDASGKVLREFTSPASEPGNWQWTKDYVWRDGQLLATVQREPGGTTPVTYHYHLDHLGTPRLITSDAGQTVGVHDYHPFGEELSGNPAEPARSRMQFTGHERDVAVGDPTASLDYMHARYYGLQVGRFLSVDPKQRRNALPNPQAYNRYSYAINSPINYVDPNGEDVVPVRVLMTRSRPQITYVDTRMIPRLQTLMTASQKQGVTFTFNEVFRTQKYHDGIKTAFTKNTTGTSPHTAGLAVDINVATSLRGTDLAGLTALAAGAQLSPLNNQAADPPHFQASDLITRDAKGKANEKFKDLIKENQTQAADFEKMRQENPERFNKHLIDLVPPQ
ncbi:MAG: RHS repeat-associated core domain-containing protein [Thermoanaerobaculia bacterium]